MYTTSACPDCFRAKFFFDQQGMEYEEVNIDYDSEAKEIVKNMNNGNQSVPTIILTLVAKDGNQSQRVLVEPTGSELQAQLEDLGVM